MRDNQRKMAREYTLANEYSPVKEQIDIGSDYAPATGEYTAPEKEFSDTIKEFEYSTEEDATGKDNKDAKKKKKLLRKMSYLVASTVAIIVIGQAANIDSALPPIYVPDTEINGGTSSEDDMGYGDDFYERREFEDALEEFIYAPQNRPYYMRNMYSIDGVKDFVEKKGMEAGETYSISGVNVYYTEEPRQYVDGRVEEGATLTFSVPRVNNRKSSYTSLEYTGTVLTKVTTHILYSDERMQSEIENLGGFGYYLYYNDYNGGDLTAKDILWSLGDDLDNDLVIAIDKEEAYVKKEIDTNRFGVVTVSIENEVAMYGDLYSKSITISFEEGSASPYEHIYITEGFPANYWGEIKSLWINAYPWEEQPGQEEDTNQEENTEQETPDNSGEESADWFNSQVEIDGVVYTFPMKVQELMDNGWTLDNILPQNIAPGVNYSATFKKGDMRFSTNMENLSDVEVPIGEGTVCGITCSEEDDEMLVPIKFPGGLVLGMSRIEVEAIFQNDIQHGDGYYYFQYNDDTEDIKQRLKVYMSDDSDTGVVNIIDYIYDVK